VSALVSFTRVAQVNVNIVLTVACVPPATCVAVSCAACMPYVPHVPCMAHVSRVPRMADMSAAGKPHGHRHDREDQPEQEDRQK
jgi:hypothetical protein